MSFGTHSLQNECPHDSRRGHRAASSNASLHTEQSRERGEEEEEEEEEDHDDEEDGEEEEEEEDADEEGEINQFSTCE
jgi:hypothetical protein